MSRPADNAALISANNRAILQQQPVRDAYADYINQSKRLQADIERLERQIVYNRSVAYRPVPMPSYQPSYYSTPRRSPVSDPVNPPSGPQSRTDSIIIRDTVRIRDTVFIAKTAARTKNVRRPPHTVFVPVTKTEVVKEKIDYKNLPPENILFGTGRATIRQVYFRKLNYLAKILRNNQELQISISGHTDKTGSPSVNELLSLKRANAVKMFFIRKGINQSRMQIMAVAAEEPLVEGNTISAKTQNRRVEIKIIG